MLRHLAKQDVSELENEFGSVSPMLLRLACTLVALPYVHYSTLRGCRRLFRPAIPAYFESELQHSAITEGRTTDGFSLDRRFRLMALSKLRTLRADPSISQELTDLRAFHLRSAHSLSPLLAIETELAWDYILLDDTELRTTIDERLRDVLFSAIYETPSRPGLITWIAGAQSRLPAECVQGTAAWLLSQFCSLEGLHSLPVTLRSDISLAGLIELFADRLPICVIGIRRTTGVLELGPPSPERSVGVTVVDTNPLVVFVSDTALGRSSVSAKPIYIPKGEVFHLDCGNDELVLGNLAGQTFTLARMIEKRSFEARMADRVINNATAACNTQKRLTGHVVRTIEAGYVVYVEEVGATAFMLSPKQELFEGEKVPVVIDRVFPERRWISVRRIGGPRSPSTQWRAGIASVPAAAMQSTVRPGDTFAARLFKHGRRIYGDRRSAHVILDQNSALKNILYSHKPGRLRFEKAVQKIDGEWYPPEGAMMLVVAAGVFNGAWELRLKVPPTGFRYHVESPLETGDTAEVTVVAIAPDGAELETSHGQLLWLPRLQCRPIPRRGHPLPLRVGQVIRVRLIGFSDARSSRALASQRALSEPYLEKLTSEVLIYGVIETQLATGEFQILADPISEVSTQPFRVASVGAIGMNLSPGDRIAARMNQFLRKRWLVLVGNISKMS